MSSKPPIHHAECLYGPTRHRRQHRRLKFEATKVSQMQKVEMTYLEHARANQPHQNNAKRCHRVIGPRHQRGRIKTAPTKVSQAQNGQTTYQMHASTVQPCGNPLKQTYGVIGPKCQHGRMKIEPGKLKIKHLNDKMVQDGKTTYLGCENATQPPRNAPKRRYGAHMPKHQCGCIKFGPANVS